MTEKQSAKDKPLTKSGFEKTLKEVTRKIEPEPKPVKSPSLKPEPDSKGR
jgi:hypothetical protein